MFKISEEKKRPWFLLWGEAGRGKTYTACQFPNPCCIFTEKEGAGYDGHIPNVRVSTFEEIRSAQTWLKDNQAKFDTLIIDSGTTLFKMFCKQYDIKNFFDWGKVKPAWVEFLDSLQALPMFVVMTARKQNVIETKLVNGKPSPVKVGERPHIEQEKTMYYFDVVLNATKENGIYYYICNEHKTSPFDKKLPSSKFPADFSMIEEVLYPMPPQQKIVKYQETIGEWINHQFPYNTRLYSGEVIIHNPKFSDFVNATKVISREGKEYTPRQYLRILSTKPNFKKPEFHLQTAALAEYMKQLETQSKGKNYAETKCGGFQTQSSTWNPGHTEESH